VVWTAAPGYAAFAAGFVIWGVGGALVSGASEALVHDGLAEVGAADSYARVNGWMVSAELLVQVPTALAASALFALGGYALVGWASAGVCLAAAALALRFPEAPRTTDGDEDDVPLRQGVIEALGSPALRWAVLGAALVGGLDAVEEYFPVLAGDWGVPTTAVPIAVLGIALAGAAGAAWAGGRTGCPPVRCPGSSSGRPDAWRWPRSGRDRRRWLWPRCSTASTWRCSWWPRRGCRPGSPARTGRRSRRSPAWGSRCRRCWCSPPGRSADLSRRHCWCWPSSRSSVPAWVPALR
jgi:hypothetical protein